VTLGYWTLLCRWGLRSPSGSKLGRGQVLDRLVKSAEGPVNTELQEGQRLEGRVLERSRQAKGCCLSFF
jgi:hypothetical protein